LGANRPSVTDALLAQLPKYFAPGAIYGLT
jgi:hypothetical protein